MPTIEYEYGIDDRVITLFGDIGIVSMIGFDDGGKQYYVKTKAKNSWFREKDLKPAKGELTEHLA